MSTNPTITLDQQLAVKTSASRLAEEFSATFNAETIERFLHSSFDEFAGKATIDKFLPLLAERFARQRLQALSRIEGHVSDGKPVVLFMCVHNAGRSQMALGFFTSYAADNAIAWSGGSEPGAEISEVAVAAMAAKGVDISGEFPKPWTDEVVQAADVVITMGRGEACPIFPGKKYEEWVLEDPAGQDIAAVRRNPRRGRTTGPAPVGGARRPSACASVATAASTSDSARRPVDRRRRSVRRIHQRMLLKPVLAGATLAAWPPPDKARVQPSEPGRSLRS
jgi:arsenate reductase (thioredoxin)